MTHLDTSFLIRALQRGSAQERQLLAWLGGAEPVSISAFAWAEFLCGPVSVEANTLARELLGEPVPIRRAEAERAAQLFNVSGRRRRSLGDCLVGLWQLLCQIAGSVRARVAAQPAPPHRAHHARRGPRGGRATHGSGNCPRERRSPRGVMER